MITKTEVLKIESKAPDERDVIFAATLLRNGGLVAFPTETVYGLGANFLNETAIKRLYEVKKRPLNKPFTIHISNIDTIEKMRCRISPLAERLIKEFWPGPLTIILKSDNGTLAFRMPDHRVAKDLISKSEVPVAAPSANISGEKPPVEAGEVKQSLDGKIELILDSGRTKMGRESTIVDATASPYKILRAGAIPEREIERVADSV